MFEVGKIWKFDFIPDKRVFHFFFFLGGGIFCVEKAPQQKVL